MNRFEIDVNPESVITIEKVGGALHIKSWDRPQIRMDFQDSSDTFDESDNTISLSSKGDCLVRLPNESELLVKKANGDTHITGIEGRVKIEDVGGSLTLKRIQSVEIEKVNGNLAARNISGNLDVQKVGGNAFFKNIQGSLQAQNISGNIDIKNCGNQVKVSAGGNSNIRSSIPPEGLYEIECKGNSNCRIDNSSNFTADFTSKTQKILVQTQDINQSLEKEKHSITLGDGSGKLIVKAGGQINFRTRDESGFHFGFDVELDDEFNAMVDEISDQVGVQMENQLEALSDQLSSLGEQMQVSGDRAIKLAQKKVEAAQKKLEKNIKARGGSFKRKTGVPIVVGMHHSADPVSEQERMKVLEMVQEKKISVDEAEMLLATLEGRAPNASESKDTGNEK